MSDKGRVFKAHFTIVDNVHHCHLHEHFTTARRAHEPLQRFILRLLGYCLFAYRHDIVICEAKTKPQLDIFVSDLHDEYELVIEVYDDNLDVLTKIHNHSKALYVITTAPVSAELAHWLALNRTVEVILVESDFVAQLQIQLARSVTWEVVVDSDELSIVTGEHYISSAITIHWP